VQPNAGIFFPPHNEIRNKKQKNKNEQIQEMIFDEKRKGHQGTRYTGKLGVKIGIKLGKTWNNKIYQYQKQQQRKE